MRSLTSCSAIFTRSTIAVAVADANYVRNVQADYIDDTYKILPEPHDFSGPPVRTDSSLERYVWQ